MLADGKRRINLAFYVMKVVEAYDTGISSINPLQTVQEMKVKHLKYSVLTGLRSA